MGLRKKLLSILPLGNEESRLLYRQNRLMDISAIVLYEHDRFSENTPQSLFEVKIFKPPR